MARFDELYDRYLSKLVGWVADALAGMTLLADWWYAAMRGLRAQLQPVRVRVDEPRRTSRPR